MSESRFHIDWRTAIKSTVVSAVATIAVAAPCLSTPAPAHKLAGRFGLSIPTGLVIANKLYQDGGSPELWAPHRSSARFGLPLGGGWHYFISDNVAAGIDLAKTEITSRTTSMFTGSWISTRTWSIMELGAHIKYIKSLSSNTSIYGKFGPKMVRLNGTFKHFRLPHHGIEISYTPGGELGVGLLRLFSKSLVLFGEVTFSHIFTKGKDVRINGEAAFWKYPFNLELYRVRVGLMLLIGGKRDKP